MYTYKVVFFISCILCLYLNANVLLHNIMYGSARNVKSLSELHAERQQPLLVSESLVLG